MNSKIENLLKQAAETHSPPNVTSSVTNASRVYPTIEEAESAFQNFKANLFLVEYWNKASEIASFAHYDQNGSEQPPHKPFVIGSMIKITLPGSGKDDWVKVLEISDMTPMEIVVTVQPSFDPTIADAQDKHTSHFFVDSSTNNFCLQRTDKKLSFYVIGIGEQTNTEDSAGVLETIRNVATSNVGYFLGIQKTQWQTFCENFIKDQHS
jgi:hypothetical protein